MKIHIKCCVHDAAGRYRLKSFAQTAPPATCCERMADEWGGIVDLGLVGFPQAANVCPVICTASFPMSDGEIVHAATPISHCPWCGEQIEIVDGGIDATPEESQCPASTPTLDF